MAFIFDKYLITLFFIAMASLWIGCSDDVEKNEKSSAESSLQKADCKSQKKEKQIVDIEYPIDSGNVQLRIMDVQDSSEYDSGQLIKEISGILKARSSKFFDIYKTYLELDYWPWGTYRYHLDIDEKGIAQIAEYAGQNADFGDFSEKIKQIIEDSLVVESPPKKRNFIVVVTFRRGNTDLTYIGDQVGTVEVTSKKIKVKMSDGIQVVRERDVVLAPGSTLNADAILYAIQLRYAGLRHVYNKFLQNEPKLDGKIVLTLTITPEGTVDELLVDSSTTKCKEFDEEIKNTIRRWRFRKSKGTTTATVPFTFVQKDFFAEDVLESESKKTDEIDSKNSVMNTDGDVDIPQKSDMKFSDAASSDFIARVIRYRASGLRHIYHRYLEKKPGGFEGVLVLSLTIAPGGSITDIFVKSSTTKFEEFDNRVKVAVRRWVFDFENRMPNENAPGAPVTVVVPFRFTNGNTVE